MKINILFFISAFFLLWGCKNNTVQDNSKQKVNTDSTLIEINKYLVKEDRERIESYIKRKGWEMKESPTGFWYKIERTGSGEYARPGDLATINYRVELLDGTLCYTSDSLGAKTFKINFSDIESGLHQGIQLMRQGDKAIFILPPYLAHGLLGDEDKIPPRSVIVYYVELLKLEHQQ